MFDFIARNMFGEKGYNSDLIVNTLKPVDWEILGVPGKRGGGGCYSEVGPL